MAYQLRIDPKRYYRQTEQDENVGSLECCYVADLESFRGSPAGCGNAGTFSLLRRPFSHAVCETIR
jgi:hypothetical protein